MTERLSHKRDCLYKDKITCSKSHLFVLEKADYTYKYAVIRQARQPTHLPVICSIPSSLQRRIITRKYAQRNHFQDVLYLSEAKGMDISMEFLIKNRLDIIAVVVSIIALGFSMYSHFKNINLQERYDILSTYGMSLNYQVEVSYKTGEGNFKFGDIEINKGQIDIIPKIGGIEKVYAIHYYQNNVKKILPVELYSKEVENYDAQRLYYRLTEYSIDEIAETSKVYFGTLYLVVKDYQNNYFTNMIVYEIEKENMSNIKTRIYSDIDLLHIYNENINVLPEFDANQMKEYQNLKNKLDEIL